MDKNLSELVFILDMSGSMGPLRNDTIGGYNTLLEEQRKQEGEANITTIVFNRDYVLLHDRDDIKNVKDLTPQDYCPCGGTAMLDAVGIAIDSLKHRIEAMPEGKKPGNVVVTIVTDGYENCSKEYNWGQIQSMIKEQREQHDWLFTFIGANIDTMKVSQKMGIDPRLAKKYTASKEGTESVYGAVSKSMNYSRGAVRNNVSYNRRDQEVSEFLKDIK